MTEWAILRSNDYSITCQNPHFMSFLRWAKKSVFMHIVPPGSTIGIVGGGQLGRMLAITAARLGYRTHVYCPEDHCSAAQVTTHSTFGSYEDIESLRKFASQVDVLTFEFEN